MLSTAVYPEKWVNFDGIFGRKLGCGAHAKPRVAPIVELATPAAMRKKAPAALTRCAIGEFTELAIKMADVTEAYIEGNIGVRPMSTSPSGIEE